MALPWIGLSAYMLFTKAMSSTQVARFGFVVTKETPFAEVLTVTLPRIGALLPFLMMVLILVFRPRGLMGTRDT